MQVTKTYLSPFSIQHEAIINWKTMTSKERPNRNGMINVPDKMMNLIDDLAVVGVIGSAQCKRIYVRSNSGKHISKAMALGLLKEHELVRNKQQIPIYTLGPTGMMLAGIDYERNANFWKLLKKEDVMQRLVFFQLHGQFKEIEGIKVVPSEKPFVAGIQILDNTFHVLVMRGNESIVQNYFKFEKDIPGRIIIVLETLNQVLPIQNEIKPFADRIRLTTDERLKMPLSEMFYEFKENKWVLESNS